MKKRTYIYILFILLVLVLLAGGGWLVSRNHQSASSQPTKVQTSEATKEIKANLYFPEGHAVLSLYDTPLAWEFTERQPLVLQLERQGDEIILADVPPVSSTYTTEGMAPEAGDMALDIQNHQVVVFAEKKAWSQNYVPVGRVSEGLDVLLQAEGQFQVYVTR